MKLREVRLNFREGLSLLYPENEIDALFYILVQHHFGFPRHILGIEPEKELTASEAEVLTAALIELKKGVPIQYNLKKTTFLDLSIEVGPGVLIPRPETEELVHWMVASHPPNNSELRILDVGTGSGCIPLGLKSLLKHAEIHGLEKSQTALRYARSNAEVNNLFVDWHEADLFTPGDLGGAFDLIVSNPPYIPESEAEKMHVNVLDFEPSEALFVPDATPLLFYEGVLQLCDTYLKLGGWVYFEIHEDFGDQMVDLLIHHGMQEVVLKRDIFGKPRFVRGQRVNSRY